MSPIVRSQRKAVGHRSTVRVSQEEGGSEIDAGGPATPRSNHAGSRGRNYSQPGSGVLTPIRGEIHRRSMLGSGLLYFWLARGVSRTSGAPMSVNTAKVDAHRKVEYKSFDELLADADRLGTGNVKTLGNWTPGQIFQHLAIAYNGSIDGFQAGFPWFIRVMGRLFKKKLISGRCRQDSACRRSSPRS